MAIKLTETAAVEVKRSMEDSDAKYLRVAVLVLSIVLQ